jgi:hypothetical protein
MSSANLPDPTSEIKTREHTLPYRVLIEELQVRRPGPSDLESRLEKIYEARNKNQEEKKKEKLLSIDETLQAVDDACDEIKKAKANLPRLPQEEVEIRSRLDQETLYLFDKEKEALSNKAKQPDELNIKLKEIEKQLKNRDGDKDKDGDKDEGPSEEIRKARATYLEKVRAYYSALGDYRNALDRGKKAEEPLKTLLHEVKLNSLCFSGGGIRSASFGLGALLELAKESSKGNHAQSDKAPPGLAGQLDYVSTVSGGGYTGSWLTAWISRHPKGYAGVVQDLAQRASSSTDPEVDQFRHLRDYTSYLAPRMGLFSLDSWTLAAIVLRNMLLNWAILLPVFAVVLLVPVFSYLGFSLVAQYDKMGHHRLLLGLAIASAGWALTYITLKLPSSHKLGTTAKPPKINFLIWAWFPLLISAWCISAYWLAHYTTTWQCWTNYLNDRFWFFAVVALIAECGLVAGRIVIALKNKDEYRHWSFWKNLSLMMAVAVANSAFVAWLLWLLATKLGPVLVKDGEDYRLFTGVAVPLVWVAFMLAVVVMNGMSAQIESEEDREWWSRSGAAMLLGTAVWVVAHFLVFYSGEIVAAVNTVFRHKLPGTAAVSLIAAILGAIASLLGFSPVTSSGLTKVDTSKLKSVGKFLSKRDLLIPALGGLFFVVLGIALANMNTAIGDWIAGKWFARCSPLLADLAGFGVEAGFALALAFLANLVVNVNTFSLHAMYRMRLIRSYLGASNLTRRPNPFTNFDPADNLTMQDAPHEAGAPLHIINMALNLVASTKLAWQQRKAESFTVSALHSGSHRVGYQRTAQYAGDRGITLGTAMAISGAAASPNMGYHSSPVLTLAMALFNARLGWWLPNPGEAGKGLWKKNSPRFSMRPLLYESFGHTSDDQPWIYLSDGGHFENLGLYEMVLRRCRHIIVIDGSADPEFKMDDLGNAVRKIHIDLGIPIDFVSAFSISKEKEKTPANRHCAVAEIKYGCVDTIIGEDGKPEEADSGWLVYIKTSMNGNEPADVLQYAATHPDFPHESTANQFFNEAQFQSYVRLGSHVVHEMVEPEPGPERTGSLTVEDFVEAARKHAGPRVFQ